MTAVMVVVVVLEMRTAKMAGRKIWRENEAKMADGGKCIRTIQKLCEPYKPINRSQAMAWIGCSRRSVVQHDD